MPRRYPQLTARLLQSWRHAPLPRRDEGMTEPIQSSLATKVGKALGGLNPFKGGGEGGDEGVSWKAEGEGEGNEGEVGKGVGERIKPDLIWLLDCMVGLSDVDGTKKSKASPNTATAAAQTQWTAEFAAAYFTTQTGKQLGSAVAEISSVLRAATRDKPPPDPEQQARIERRIEERLTPFFNLIVRAQKCTVRVPGPKDKDEADGEREEAQRTLGPSNENGISVNRVTLQGERGDGDVVAVEVVEPSVGQVLGGEATFAAPSGWAVVSDIDDTIKRTLTRDAVGILRTTFVDDAEVIGGMPELYAWLVGKLERPPFWYLSASPYNLYPFLHTFRDAHYPAGPLVLRRASWQNLMGFLASLTKGTKEYKVEQLRKIHVDFPHRNLLCFGDSTQSDPEAYATLYREAPGWIRGIFIRRVKDVVEVTDKVPGHGDDAEKRNSDERFEKAFEGVDRRAWYIFDEPGEVYPRVEEVLRAG